MAVAVVTGGASGIGAAVVERLGRAGYEPVVWDVQPGAGAVSCDVADPQQVRRAMGQTLASAGRPTVLVTCAGVGGFAPVIDVTVEQWERILAVNLRGTLLCLQAVARQMVDGGSGGSIVCISSINGRVADRGLAAYCCSKAAVDMLVRVAASELGPHGIRVNGVAPGVTDTPMLRPTKSVPGFLEGVVARTPLGGVGRAHHVADAVVGLLAADWITGQVLVVDGGLTLHSPVDMFSVLNRPGPRASG